jgi:hypothetical protein
VGLCQWLPARQPALRVLFRDGVAAEGLPARAEVIAAPAAGKEGSQPQDMSIASAKLPPKDTFTISNTFKNSGRPLAQVQTGGDARALLRNRTSG